VVDDLIPTDLIAAGQKLYGRKYWKTKLAEALGVNVATIHRMVHREGVPGPYAIAITALLEHKKRKDELDRAARSLLPRQFRKRKTARKTKPGKRKLIPYAGAPE
jgi:hypothetical protein